MIVKRKTNIEGVKAEILKILRQIKRPGIETLISWLLKSDYFIAPKSGNPNLPPIPGGLAKHSLDVYKIAKSLYESGCMSGMNGYKKYSLDSIAIAALLHDACKIDIQGHQVLEGHGEKSVKMIEEFGGLKLSKDEREAILYHMGQSKYEPIKPDIRAIKASQLSGLIQVADKLSTIYSKDI